MNITEIGKEKFLKDGEKIDDLQREGLSIIQKKSGFSFGVDSVLLANFVNCSINDTLLDIGTGTGIIPLLVSAKSECENIVGIEIQEGVADMASRSIKMNNLIDKIKVINADVRKFALEHKSEFSIVVSNPPYFKKNATIISSNEEKMLSRHEINLSVEELFESASSLLKNKGRFYLIHRPDRMVDIFNASRQFNLEPKKAKMVHSKINDLPKLVIIECVKGSGAELRWLKPLHIYNEDGTYSEEIYSIYENTKITSFN